MTGDLVNQKISNKFYYKADRLIQIVKVVISEQLDHPIIEDEKINIGTKS